MSPSPSVAATAAPTLLPAAVFSSMSRVAELAANAGTVCSDGVPLAALDAEPSTELESSARADTARSLKV